MKSQIREELNGRDRGTRGDLWDLQQRGSGAILALCPRVPLKRDRTLWRYL